MPDAIFHRRSGGVGELELDLDQLGAHSWGMIYRHFFHPRTYHMKLRLLFCIEPSNFRMFVSYNESG